jgi:creatine kinase
MSPLPLALNTQKLQKNNCMASQLDPAVYTWLFNKTTPAGWTPDQCTQISVDNPGHLFIKTRGMVAGVEDTYI